MANKLEIFMGEQKQVFVEGEFSAYTPFFMATKKVKEIIEVNEGCFKVIYENDEFIVIGNFAYIFLG